jgi:hypothetical protein
MDAATVSGRV